VLSRRATFVAAAERLANLHRQVERLEVDLERARGEAHLAVASLTAADEVITAARRSERDLVRQMFENIAPTMDALYGRLRPHPVLDRLRLDVGSFDERGEVRFVAYSATADANVTNIFSSAELNAVAVCIFLAMNLAVVRSKAAFALLDDPIQNMDDFNVLGLLDLLRGLLGDRQFILSTHDDQIGDLLRRKLRPVKSGDQTIVHRFTAYGSAGPIVDTVTDSYMESTRVLEAASPV
jgi:exonuclease SbcC